MDTQNLPSYTNTLPDSTLALISMISGILGFTFIPVVGGIVALITGYMARRETRSVPPTAGGDGMATAGIIMGWIQMGLIVVGFCCLAAFVFLFAAPSGANWNWSNP